MNKHLLKLMSRYMAPAGDDGAAGGGGGETVDRGDDYTPTEEELEAAAAETAAAAAAAKTTEPADKGKEDDKGGKDDGKGGKDDAKDDKGGKDDDKGAAADADKGKGKKDTRIPLERHTEILNRERARADAAEAELQRQREAAKATQVKTNVTELEAKLTPLEEKYASQLAEGNTKDAAATMREIRQLERQIIEQQATARTEAATAAAVEQVRYDTTVERIEAAYPQLRKDSDEFDEALVAEVLDLADAFERKGLTPSAALQKAVGYAVKPATKKQEEATTVVPRVNEEDAEKAKADREKEARRKAVEAANAQPASLDKAGANSDAAGGVLDAKSVIKMPFEKFVKLDEETLSRMRGDTL